MIGSTQIQLGGIVAAWAALTAITAPQIPINLSDPLHHTLTTLLAAITIIWAVRGSVLWQALKAGRVVEREAAHRKTVRSIPRQVV